METYLTILAMKRCNLALNLYQTQTMKRSLSNSESKFVLPVDPD